MGDFPHTVVRSLSSAWNATLGYLQALWLATASSNVDLHVPAKVSNDDWWRAYLPLMPEGIRTALGDDKAAVIVPVIVTVLLTVVGVCVCACLCCCVRRCCSRRRRLNEKEGKVHSRPTCTTLAMYRARPVTVQILVNSLHNGRISFFKYLFFIFLAIAVQDKSH